MATGDLDEIDGKQIDCVQSIAHTGGRLSGFTIRFMDGSLLKVDAKTHGYGYIEVEFLKDESRYLNTSAAKTL